MESSEAMALESFGSYYTKIGKVSIFPDVTEPNDKVYEEQDEDQTPSGGASAATADVEPRPYQSQLKPHILNIEKWKGAQKAGKEKGQLAEIDVVERVKAALEKIDPPDDSPILLLYNQGLDIMLDPGEKQESDEKQEVGKKRVGEIDAMVLHSVLGVLLLEVKANKKYMRRKVQEATQQLRRAQNFIQQEMGDLLEETAIVLTIALPYLKERLEDHPEIKRMQGSTAEVFEGWVRLIQEHRKTLGHAFKGSTAEDRLRNFKLACIRRCSIAGLRPGQAVKASADLHHRFLLTEEQLRVRDCQAELLHISGPFGSGKTLLLGERGRRWLQEGRRLALAVGVRFDLLLRHLSESVCGEKTDMARVSTHSGEKDLLKWLDTVSTEDPVSIIVDEAGFFFSSYSRILDYVTEGRVRGLWTAHTTPWSDEDERKLQRLGGITFQLSHCLRCPPHVIEWTGSVRGTKEPPLLPPPVPVTRELSVKVEVISHPDHHHSQPWRTCPRCREEVRAFFSSLGLHGPHATSALSLSDVVVLTTDTDCDREEVAAWLHDLGVHAVAEERGKGRQGTPVLPPGVAPTSPDVAEREAVRQRILKGKDVTGSPAVQVMLCGDFLGLERKVVLLWHEDTKDEDRNFLTQRRREERMSRHRVWWFPAASRCQGRLAVMVATPSPLLPLLSATSPPKSSAATASSTSPVTSASHHSPVSSSSLGGESNPRPPVRPSGRSSTKAAGQDLKSNPRPSSPPEEPALHKKSSAATASSTSPVTSASHHSPVSSSSLGGESNPRPPVCPSGRSSTKTAGQDLKSNPRPSSPPE